MLPSARDGGTHVKTVIPLIIHVTGVIFSMDELDSALVGENMHFGIYSCI